MYSLLFVTDCPVACFIDKTMKKPFSQAPRGDRSEQNIIKLKTKAYFRKPNWYFFFSDSDKVQPTFIHSSLILAGKLHTDGFLFY
jgi:hypothetical protein